MNLKKEKKNYGPSTTSSKLTLIDPADPCSYCLNVVFYAVQAGVNTIESRCRECNTLHELRDDMMGVTVFV